MKSKINLLLKFILLSCLLLNLKILNANAEINSHKNIELSNIKITVNNIGWNNIDNKWYYYEGNGKFKKGWLYRDKNWYFLNYETATMETGWIKDGNNQYYLTASGEMQTGWQFIDSKWYYFDSSGSMARGWRNISNKWYYFHRDGYMAIGFIDEGSNRYYLNSDGSMQIGWGFIGNKWYYFDSSGSIVRSWRNISNKWYYFHRDGSMAIGFIDEGSNRYYLNSDGLMQIGWGFIGNKWYYFDSSGSMVRGWKYLGNKWYFMNNEGVMMTGWANDNGTWYYLNSSGTMVTGWILQDGVWYYLKSSGEMAKGWNYIDSKWYIMNNEGKILTGWNNVDGLWYYLESSGFMATGWRNINSKWYYLDSSGKRLTNQWSTISGIKYWFNGEGIMATGESVIGGDSYSFDSSGRYLNKIGKKPYLYVEFLNTGDSDSIYIKLPNGEDVLIDGGESWNGKDIVKYLKTRNLAEEDGIPDIDYVINTHPHSDHIGGLVDVFENFKVNKFYYPHDIEMKKYEGFEGAESIENQGYNINCMNYCYQFYKKIIDLADEKGVEVYDTTSGTYIDPYNILKFIHPNKIYKQNYLDNAPEEINGLAYCSFNNDSAVISASYYDFKMILAGDIHMQVERDMVNLGLIPNETIDILKIGHHGYDTSTSREFIDALRPSFGIVTRSKIMYNSVNSHKNSSKVLKDYNVDLLETWRGNIRVYATDKDWNVEY